MAPYLFHMKAGADLIKDDEHVPAAGGRAIYKADHTAIESDRQPLNMLPSWRF
jgi:hypothetical protein